MKFAIYEPVFTRTRAPQGDEWRVRLDVVGTVEHVYSPEAALRAAKEAGFASPIVGPWKEGELQ